MAGSTSSNVTFRHASFYSAAHALMRPRPPPSATCPNSSSSVASSATFAKPNHIANRDSIELSGKESQHSASSRMSIFSPLDLQIDYDEQLRILDLDAIIALHKQGRTVFDRPHQYKLFDACFISAAGSASMRPADRLLLLIWLEGLVATLAELHQTTLNNCIDSCCRLLDYAFSDLSCTPQQFIDLEPGNTFIKTIQLAQMVYLSFLGFTRVSCDNFNKSFFQLFQDQVQAEQQDTFQQPAETSQTTDSVIRLYESLRKSFPFFASDKQVPSKSLLNPKDTGLVEAKIRNLDIVGWHENGFIQISQTNVWTLHLSTTSVNGVFTIYIHDNLNTVFRLFNHHKISSLKVVQNSSIVEFLLSIGKVLDSSTRLLFHTPHSRQWAINNGIAPVEFTVDQCDATLQSTGSTLAATLIYRRLQTLQYTLGHPVTCIIRDIYIKSHLAPLSSYTTIIVGILGLILLCARSIVHGSRKKWLQILNIRICHRKQYSSSEIEYGPDFQTSSLPVLQNCHE